VRRLHGSSDVQPPRGPRGQVPAHGLQAMAQRQRRCVDSPGFLNPGFWNPILRRTLKGFRPSQAQPATDRTPTGFDRRMDSQTQGSRTLGWPTESRWDSPIADSPRRGLGGWATWRGHRRRRPSWWIATTPAALLAEPLRKAKLPTARPGVRISLASGQGKSARSSSNQINAHLRGVEPVVAVSAVLSNPSLRDLAKQPGSGAVPLTID